MFDNFEFEYRRCLRCSTIFVYPMPDEAVLDRLYAPGYLQTHYGQALAGEHQQGELVEESLQTASALPAHSRVLDVGCGAGSFLRAVTSRGLVAEGYERVASTASAAAAATGLSVHTGSLDAIHGAFDVVHLADVLEHLPAPALMLSKLRRLLVPDGTLVARGPLEGQRHLFGALLRLRREFLSRTRGLPISAIPPWHVVLFSLDGWHALFARCGYSIARERTYETAWPVVADGSARSLMKGVSRLLSASPLGKRAALANRVVTWAKPSVRTSQ